MTFIIYSLPRSRSAWLSHYLNYPLARPLQPVVHNMAVMCSSVENFVKAYVEKGLWGSVEPNGIVGWQLLRREMPDLKTVVVRRPLQDVYNSITQIGMHPILAGLAERNEMLEALAMQPGVYSVDFAALNTPEMCKWLFEYCLELEFDFDWWSSLNTLNIQVDLESASKVMPEMERNFALFQADILERMKGIVSCLN